MSARALAVGTGLLARFAQEQQRRRRRRGAPKGTPQERIVAAALRWDEMRRWAQDLKQARAALECERAERADHHSYIAEPPCWKRYDSEGNRETGDWCDACTQRQQFHDALTRVRRQRGSAQRVLQRAVRLLQPDLPRVEWDGRYGDDDAPLLRG